MKSFTDISTIEELIQYTLVYPSYLEGPYTDGWIGQNLSWLKDCIIFESADLEYCRYNLPEALRFTIISDYWYVYKYESHFGVILDLYKAALLKNDKDT